MMKTMPDVSTLYVLLYGEPIGTITHVGGDRTLFAFTESYIQNAQRPVLSLGFKDAFGELITEFAPTQTKGHVHLSGVNRGGQRVPAQAARGVSIGVAGGGARANRSASSSTVLTPANASIDR